MGDQASLVSDLGLKVVEGTNEIIAALQGAKIKAVAIDDDIVSQLHLTNGTILTGAMVVQRQETA
jgi:hypothetical protein